MSALSLTAFFLHCCNFIWSHPHKLRRRCFWNRRLGRDDVKPGNIFHEKQYYGGSREYVLPKRKITVHSLKCKTCYVNNSLNWRNYILNCVWAICIMISDVQQYRWWYPCPWRCLEEIRLWSWARQRQLLVLHYLLIASKRRLDSLSSRCCSLFVWINVLQHLDVSFNQ